MLPDVLMLFLDNIQNNNIRKCEFKTLPLLEYLKNSIINYPSMIRISDSNSIFTIIKFMNAQVNILLPNYSGFIFFQKASHILLFSFKKPLHSLQYNLWIPSVTFICKFIFWVINLRELIHLWFCTDIWLFLFFRKLSFLEVIICCYNYQIQISFYDYTSLKINSFHNSFQNRFCKADHQLIIATV